MDGHLLYAIRGGWLMGGLFPTIAHPVLALSAKTFKSEEAKAMPSLPKACVKMHIKDIFLEILDHS